MKVNLNDSEIMAILELIEQGMYDYEDLFPITLLSVVRKIDNEVQYQHHNAIDDKAIQIRNSYEWITKV